ncbi:MAG TPA: DUF4351 domain-containing protein [Polyangiaceae bacterium]|nr:DUF4351 domain-containing protein [Polyangiaceae bacterium]
MAGSDRAFRALAHAEPDVIVDTLRLLCPALVAEGASVTPEDLEPTRLDALAPAREADWVARVGGAEILHAECQGYREGDFTDRLLRYHLSLVLRAWSRRVSSVALWLRRPPEAQLARVVRHHRVSVEVEHVVVPEVPAEQLLASARTACFAPAAAPGPLTAEALCLRAAEVLWAGEAGWYRWHMAVVCAATQGRYRAMLDAMSQVGVERIVIEDLVEFGKDQGLIEGRLEGEAKVLLKQLALRFGPVPEGVEARVRSASEAELDRWAERVLTAASLDDVLAG